MTTPDPSFDEQAPSQNAAMIAAHAQLIDGLAIQAEAALGYRNRLEAQGWSPTQAEQIASHVAVYLNRLTLNQLTPTPGSPT